MAKAVVLLIGARMLQHERIVRSMSVEAVNYVSDFSVERLARDGNWSVCL